jgi:hypothetical protein
MEVMKNRRMTGRPAGDGMDIPSEMFKHSADAWKYRNLWHMKKNYSFMCELWMTSAKTFLDWCKQLEYLDKRLRTLLNMPTKDPMRSESLVQDLEDFRNKARIRCSKPDQMDEGIQERISLITRDYYAGEKEIQLSLPFLEESEA